MVLAGIAFAQFVVMSQECPLVGNVFSPDMGTSNGPPCLLLSVGDELYVFTLERQDPSQVGSWFVLGHLRMVPHSL